MSLTTLEKLFGHDFEHYGKRSETQVPEFCSDDLRNWGRDTRADQIRVHGEPYKVGLSDVSTRSDYRSVVYQEIVKSHPVYVRM